MIVTKQPDGFVRITASEPELLVVYLALVHEASMHRSQAIKCGNRADDLHDDPAPRGRTARLRESGQLREMAKAHRTAASCAEDLIRVLRHLCDPDAQQSAAPDGG